MKRMSVLVVLLLVIASVVIPVAGQDQYAWCGYVLVDGLPPTETDLMTIAMEAITPPEDMQYSQPDELLQTRASLDGTQVILEACFKVEPSRQLVLLLLAYYLPGEDIDVLSERFGYTMFAPGGTREQSQSAVSDFLDDNRLLWEPAL